MSNQNNIIMAEKETKKGVRPLYEIAKDIRDNWKKPHWEAKPYIDAMASLNKLSDMYGWDSGENIVLFFLSHAGSWRGEKAREIKNELKEMVK